MSGWGPLVVRAAGLHAPTECQQPRRPHQPTHRRQRRVAVAVGVVARVGGCNRVGRTVSLLHHRIVSLTPASASVSGAGPDADPGPRVQPPELRVGPRFRVPRNSWRLRSITKLRRQGSRSGRPRRSAWASSRRMRSTGPSTTRWHGSAMRASSRRGRDGADCGVPPDLAREPRAKGWYHDPGRSGRRARGRRRGVIPAGL
jgi:hypothetical protein